jgi:transcriptional regulator of NAD metabolism
MEMHDERENTALGRFEILAELYLEGSEEVQAVILNELNEEEKKAFIQGVGLYHLFIDEQFYKAVQDATCEQFYKEALKA